MAELLLRGAQTEGELRGRASRMEPIADLNALRGILDALRARGLVIELTPPGRGQIISHNLYEPEELERLKGKLGGGGEAPASTAPQPRASYTASPAVAPSAVASSAASDRTAEELRSVRTELAELRRELELLAETVHRQEDEVAALRSSLGG